MSGPGAVKLVKSGTILPAGPLYGSASSRFITSAYASCSAIVYLATIYTTFIFFYSKCLNPEGVAKREHKIRELSLFQL